MVEAVESGRPTFHDAVDPCLNRSPAPEITRKIDPNPFGFLSTQSKMLQQGQIHYFQSICKIVSVCAVYGQGPEAYDGWTNDNFTTVPSKILSIISEIYKRINVIIVNFHAQSYS